MSGATAAPSSGTAVVARATVTKDTAVADLVVAAGETLVQTNLAVPAGISYDINGSAVVNKLDVISTGILNVAAAELDEVAV